MDKSTTIHRIKTGVIIFGGLLILLNLFIEIQKNTSNPINLESHSLNLNEIQTQLYYRFLEDDFINSQQANGFPLIESNIWLNLLGISGKAQANSILQDFDKNEVAAVQKYSGRWIITGEIASVDDSFGHATVMLGDRHRFQFFNAEIENKERAAFYHKGQVIDLFCNRIEEAVTFVYGFDCLDYNDWIGGALKTADDQIRNKELKVEGLPVSFILSKLVTTLPESSICFKNLYTDECEADILHSKKIFKEVARERQ